MAYGKISATKLNDLMQQRLIVAKKRGATVIVELNSVDDYYAALPEVGAHHQRRRLDLTLVELVAP